MVVYAVGMRKMINTSKFLPKTSGDEITWEDNTKMDVSEREYSRLI
jgi:hypothetical protein